MTDVPLASKECRFAQWSYLTYGPTIPGAQNGMVVEASELTPPPPYFVHVLVYGTTDVSALGFALPRGRPTPLTDTLLQRTNRRRAVLISRVVWAGHSGELILAPSFPGGGEMGSHLIFSYKTGRIYRGISLHPWPSVYRYPSITTASIALSNLLPTRPTRRSKQRFDGSSSRAGEPEGESGAPPRKLASKTVRGF